MSKYKEIVDAIIAKEEARYPVSGNKQLVPFDLTVTINDDTFTSSGLTPDHQMINNVIYSVENCDGLKDKKIKIFTKIKGLLGKKK